MIKLFKHTTFKYLLLMILSLKAGYFIVENIQVLNDLEVSYVVSPDDFESEKEGKKELDENEKIHQLAITSGFKFSEDQLKKHFPILPKFRNLYFEFTTQPPERI